jgi:GNAT superfamily N-acetyltransferase
MSEAATLRRAVATDAAAVRQLTRDAYAKWVAVIGREPKPMTADYAHALRYHWVDLLYLQGELAALIETIPKGDHLLIENVAVSPPFQRRGLGGKLLAHAERLALSLGHGKTRLYTNQLFVENVRLYKKLGYRVDREEEFAGGIVVHMSKTTASPNGPDRRRYIQADHDLLPVEEGADDPLRRPRGPADRGGDCHDLVPRG